MLNVDKLNFCNLKCTSIVYNPSQIHRRDCRCSFKSTSWSWWCQHDSFILLWLLLLVPFKMSNMHKWTRDSIVTRQNACYVLMSWRKSHVKLRSILKTNIIVERYNFEQGYCEGGWPIPFFVLLPPTLRQAPIFFRVSREVATDTRKMVPWAWAVCIYLAVSLSFLPVLLHDSSPLIHDSCDRL